MEKGIVLNGKYLEEIDGIGRIAVRSLGNYILGVYERMMERQKFESKWITENGKEEITDVGYASDGAFYFLEEIMDSLGMSERLMELDAEAVKEWAKVVQL